MRSSLLALTVIALSYVPNGAAVAKEIPYSMRGCSVTDVSVLAKAGGVTIGSSKARGASASIPPGNPESFDAMAYECHSTWNASKAGVEFSGRCTFVGKGDDRLVGAYTSNGAGWDWKFLSGTGKWEGIKGGGQSKVVLRPAKLKPSVTTGCWESTGSYTLAK